MYNFYISLVLFILYLDFAYSESYAFCNLNCCRFVFYNNTDSFDIHFYWNFLEHSTSKKDKIACSPSYCFHGLFFTLIKHNCPLISAREIAQLV